MGRTREMLRRGKEKGEGVGTFVGEAVEGEAVEAVRVRAGDVIVDA